MRFIPLFRNKMNGNISIVTNDGYFFVDKFFFSDEIFDNFIEKNRIIGIRETITQKLLEQHYEIELFGIYNNLLNTISISTPISTKTTIDNAFKISKKICFKNLCKEFILCCQKKITDDNVENFLNKIHKDIQEKIIKIILDDYYLF